MKTGALRRLAVSGVLGAVLVLGAMDLSRAPGRQVTAKAAIASIRLYQHAVAPLVARAGVRCRFTPSCSHYAEATIRRHGLLAGGWMAAKRIARCGPWTPRGTVDVPR